MVVKTVNDSASSDGLHLTFLIFGAYLRIKELDALLPNFVQRVGAMKAAMKAVLILHDKCKANYALSMRNGLKTSHPWNLPINPEVLVWRETGKWTGP